MLNVLLRTTRLASTRTLITGRLQIKPAAPNSILRQAVASQCLQLRLAYTRNSGPREYSKRSPPRTGQRSVGKRPSAEDYDAVASDSAHEVDITEADEVTKFQELVDRNMIDPRVIRVITDDLKYDEMTKVQRKTICSTLAGNDVLAQAKTGTGKTFAFLLPAIQRLLSSPTPLMARRVDIRCIIISPTRELAMQIHKDAVRLTEGTSIVVQAAVGGMGKQFMLRDMKRTGCHMLVATPGRLNDLMTDPYSGVEVAKVDTLVLDEGDTLLDQGFAQAVTDIVQRLPGADTEVRGPGEGRQSLIFSATMPPKVLDMVRKTLKPDYKFLKMVQRGEAAVHERVTQHYVMCKGFENILPTVYEIANREISAKPEEGAEIEPFKSIVFFPTTKFATLAAATFREMRQSAESRHPLHPLRVVEIHSHLTQSQRTNAAEYFRRSTSAIMFASDVVARGMDFPNVTHVIQVSTPRDKESYIHRLGRTARANKTGTGYLIVTEPESTERTLLSIISGVKMIRNEHGLLSPDVPIPGATDLPQPAAEALGSINAATARVPKQILRSTYTSMLGYFSYMRDKQVLVNYLNQWSRLGWGWETPPAVSKMLVNKMGFTGFTGLNTDVVVGESDQSGPEPKRFGRQREGFAQRDGAHGDRPREGFTQRDGAYGDRPREGFAQRDGARGDRPRESFARRDGAYGDRPREGFAQRDGARGDRPRDGFARRDDAYGSRPRDNFARRDDSYGNRPRGPRDSSAPYQSRNNFARRDGSYGDRPQRSSFNSPWQAGGTEDQDRGYPRAPRQPRVSAPPWHQRGSSRNWERNAARKKL